MPKTNLIDDMLYEQREELSKELLALRKERKDLNKILQSLYSDTKDIVESSQSSFEDVLTEVIMDHQEEILTFFEDSVKREFQV